MAIEIQDRYKSALLSNLRVERFAAVTTCDVDWILLVLIAETKW